MNVSPVADTGYVSDRGNWRHKALARGRTDRSGTNNLTISTT